MHVRPWLRMITFNMRPAIEIYEMLDNFLSFKVKPLVYFIFSRFKLELKTKSKTNTAPSTRDIVNLR